MDDQGGFEVVQARLDAALAQLERPHRRRRVLPDDGLAAGVVAVGVVALLALSAVVGPRPANVPVAPEPAATLAAPEGPTVEAPPVDSGPDLAARTAPVTLRIGAIAVDAPVVPVGLEADGAMEIPVRVDEIGWYDPDGLGVAPGEVGTAVFSSHVDSRTQGRGVLFELRQMRSGQTIEVELEDGTVQRWLVTSVAQYPKVAMPLNDIFTWSGPSRLVVITCGGEFDRSRRSYTDNVVVYAEPLVEESA